MGDRCSYNSSWHKQTSASLDYCKLKERLNTFVTVWINVTKQLSLEPRDLSRPKEDTRICILTAVCDCAVRPYSLKSTSSTILTFQNIVQQSAMKLCYFFYLREAGDNGSFQVILSTVVSLVKWFTDVSLPLIMCPRRVPLIYLYCSKRGKEMPMSWNLCFSINCFGTPNLNFVFDMQNLLWRNSYLSMSVCSIIVTVIFTVICIYSIFELFWLLQEVLHTPLLLSVFTIF